MSRALLSRLDAIERALMPPPAPRCELEAPTGHPGGNPAGRVSAGWCGKRPERCRCVRELAAAPPDVKAHWLAAAAPGPWAASYGRGWVLYRALLQEVFRGAAPDDRRADGLCRDLDGR